MEERSAAAIPALSQTPTGNSPTGLDSREKLSEKSGRRGVRHLKRILIGQKYLGK